MSKKEAVAVLEARLAELEHKGNALIQVINDLRAEDGLPPRSLFVWGGRGAQLEQTSRDLTLAEIRSDVFAGKKLQTAVREYLTLRKLRDAGPATPREIYDGLARGGFKFGAKSEADAFANLRTLLRKRAAFFHKLPNGTYGMTAWYPSANKKGGGRSPKPKGAPARPRLPSGTKGSQHKGRRLIPKRHQNRSEVTAGDLGTRVLRRRRRRRGRAYAISSVSSCCFCRSAPVAEEPHYLSKLFRPLYSLPAPVGKPC